MAARVAPQQRIVAAARRIVGADQRVVAAAQHVVAADRDHRAGDRAHRAAAVHPARCDHEQRFGATAARSLTGRPVTISRMRGTPVTMRDGARLVITIHPSALLRMEDEDEKHAAYLAFVKDLKAAAKLVSEAAA